MLIKFLTKITNLITLIVLILKREASIFKILYSSLSKILLRRFETGRKSCKFERSYGREKKLFHN